jgi:hypothetical protein
MRISTVDNAGVFWVLEQSSSADKSSSWVLFKTDPGGQPAVVASVLTPRPTNEVVTTWLLQFTSGAVADTLLSAFALPD